MKKSKLQHTEAIRTAIEEANKDGYKIVVASDPEGNSWNSINPVGMEYGSAKPNVIALGVWASVEEDEVFLDEE